MNKRIENAMGAIVVGVFASLGLAIVAALFLPGGTVPVHADEGEPQQAAQAFIINQLQDQVVDLRAELFDERARNQTLWERVDSIAEDVEDLHQYVWALTQGLYDTNDNNRISCAEAREHGITPVYMGHPAYLLMRDTDGDGIICERGDQ